MSERELANLLWGKGSKVTKIKYWESLAQRISYDYLLKLAAILRCEPEDLTGRAVGRAAPMYKKARSTASRANICFDCENACGGALCQWADRLEPVPGWTAEVVSHSYRGDVIDTYHVTACPNFIKGRAARVKGKTRVKAMKRTDRPRFT